MTNVPYLTKAMSRADDYSSKKVLLAETFLVMEAAIGRKPDSEEMHSIFELVLHAQE